jgi:hypothetical protein
LDKRRQAVLTQDGEHEATLERIGKADTPTGRYLRLVFRTKDGGEITFQPLIEPKRKDLEVMSLDHQNLLLDFLEAVLGVEEVPELLTALKEAVGRPVVVETKQRQGRGQTRVNVTAFRAAPGHNEGEVPF